MIEAKAIAMVCGGVTIGGVVSIGIAAAVGSVVEAQTQDYTALGILGATIFGFGSLLIKLGWKMNESIEKNTSAVSGLVEQLKILVTQNAAGQQLIRENSNSQAERILRAIGDLHAHVREHGPK